jgi:RNA polymerase sigma-70 factor, ECF subfamily
MPQQERPKIKPRRKRIIATLSRRTELPGREERLPSTRMSGDFAVVYDEQVGNVYGFFAYRVGNCGDAEDLTQQTFERALRAWPRYDPRRAPPGVWLMAIARNLLIDHYRADGRVQREPLEEVPEERLGSEVPDPSFGLDPELAEALAALSPRDREVIALRFGADLSGPEIAELTEYSLDNVQQILSRSLRRLRTALEEKARD